MPTPPELEEKFVAVRPDGSICGPIGDTAEFVMKSFVIGASRVHGYGVKWETIEKLGYSVRKAEISLIDDSKPKRRFWTPRQLAKHIRKTGERFTIHHM